MRRFSQGTINTICVLFFAWMFWDTARFYVASPSSLSSVAAIAAVVSVAVLVVGLLVSRLKKEQRRALHGGVLFAAMLLCSAMSLAMTGVFLWAVSLAGFSLQLAGTFAALILIFAVMSFTSYRDWREWKGRSQQN